MKRKTDPLSLRYSTFINLTIEACKYLNGTEEANSVVKWLLDMLTREVAIPIHPCPYSGIFAINNLTLAPGHRALQFPKGSYMTTGKYYDDVDENIATGTIVLELS
jgi:hypothetical protein